MKRIIYIVTACAFLSVSTAKAQQVLTLKECLEEGLQNNYSLRIVHNEEQISKNNATLGNAGYFPTLDFSAGYTGNLDNIESKARATGEITKNNGVYDQTVNVGLNLNWTIFDGFNISTTYKQLKELERQGETNTRIAIEDFIADLTSEYYNFYPTEDPSEKLSLCNVALQRTPAYSRSESSCRKVLRIGLSTGESRLQCRQCSIYQTTGIAALIAYPVK